LLDLGLSIAEKNPNGARVVYSTCSILKREAPSGSPRALVRHPRARLSSEFERDPGSAGG